MELTSTASPSQLVRRPVGWLGHAVLAAASYVGGVTLLAMASLGSALWPINSGNHTVGAPGFLKTLMHQLFWMLAMGLPLVGLIHIAIGSFLSLQAYYGSTFVDGTGAVVGVGSAAQYGRADDRAHVRGHLGRADDSGTANPVSIHADAISAVGRPRIDSSAPC